MNLFEKFLHTAFTMIVGICIYLVTEKIAPGGWLGLTVILGFSLGFVFMDFIINKINAWFYNRYPNIKQK